MHHHFKKYHYQSKTGARELFRIPALTARNQLLKTDKSLRIGYLEKTTRLNENYDLKVYLYNLFNLTGLYGQYDLQESWTISIFPATGRNGRYFTINIGRHEVAFSTLPEKGETESLHVLIMDSLIQEYPKTIQRIKKYHGEIHDASYYKSAGERVVSISLFGDLARAQEFLDLPGVSRAMIAYWYDRLAILRKNKSKSLHARFHDYDAAYELLNFKRARENVFPVSCNR